MSGVRGGRYVVFSVGRFCRAFIGVFFFGIIMCLSVIWCFVLFRVRNVVVCVCCVCWDCVDGLIWCYWRALIRRVRYRRV